MNIKPYSSTLPADSADRTTTDVDVPTHQELAHRMVLEVHAEQDPHKRAVARANLIRFLTDGARIAGLAARSK